MEQVLLCLASANIELIPAAELTTHYLFTRDGFVSLVERRQSGFGNIGATGLLTENGMAQLVWKGESAFFVARGYSREATSEEVTLLRSFASDLKKCLSA